MRAHRRELRYVTIGGFKLNSRVYSIYTIYKNKRPLQNIMAMLSGLFQYMTEKCKRMNNKSGFSLIILTARK